MRIVQDRVAQDYQVDEQVQHEQGAIDAPAITKGLQEVINQCFQSNFVRARQWLYSTR